MPWSASPKAASNAINAKTKWKIANDPASAVKRWPLPKKSYDFFKRVAIIRAIRHQLPLSANADVETASKYRIGPSREEGPCGPDLFRQFKSVVVNFS
jgi:hypothetical protein